jgi:Uma2 family endonuclease
MPSVFGHSETIRLLFLLLYQWAQNHRSGEFFQETTFILPDRYDANWVVGSRTPDLLFVRAARLEQYRRDIPDYRSMPLALIPDMVIEVVSPNDSYSDLDEKVDYLTEGVPLIWIIDPQRKKVAVHTQAHPAGVKLSGEAMLDGGEIFPELRIPLAAIFPASE